MALSTYFFNSGYLLPPSPLPKTSTASKMTAAVIFAAVGTGAMLTGHNLESLTRQIYDPNIHIESHATSKMGLSSHSPAEHVASIREIFSLNTSDLAAVLDVTRPTVYAWLQGQEPKPETLIHIQQLSQWAAKIKPLKIDRIDTLLRRPIFEGHSLLDKLKAHEDILKYLPIIKTLADKEAQARLAPKGSSNNIRSLSDAAGDYSTPFYDQD